MMRLVVILYGLGWGSIFAWHARAMSRRDGWRLGLTGKMRVPLVWAVASVYYGLAAMWTVLGLVGHDATGIAVSRVGIITITLPLAVMSHSFYRRVRRGDYE